MANSRGDGFIRSGKLSKGMSGKAGGIEAEKEVREGSPRQSTASIESQKMSSPSRRASSKS